MTAVEYVIILTSGLMTCKSKMVLCLSYHSAMTKEIIT